MNKKILILTAAHPLKASGIIAYDLMNCLKKGGHEVELISNSSIENKIDNVISTKTNSLNGVIRKITNRISYKFRLAVNNYIIKPKFDYYMFSLDSNFNKKLGKRIFNIATINPDVIIYLFPQYFLKVSDLYYLQRKYKAKVFWYMMDMAPMTGGCHYAWDCEGYKKKCGSCPGLDSNDENDITNQIFTEKKKYIEKLNMVPVAGTEYQYQQLSQSSLFKDKTKEKILLTIDEKIFKPRNPNKSKEYFNIPKDKRVIMFGSVKVTEKRKGMDKLLKALQILSNVLTYEQKSKLHFVIAGNKTFELKDKIKFEHTFLGYLNYEDLARAFQASDLFICPSIEDSGPMMINQSIMSGVPVISFKMGVALDLVIESVTGFISTDFTGIGLSKKIVEFINVDDKKLKQMKISCRELAMAKYSKRVHLKNWNQIFNQNT